MSICHSPALRRSSCTLSYSRRKLKLNNRQIIEPGFKTNAICGQAESKAHCRSYFHTYPKTFTISQRCNNHSHTGHGYIFTKHMPLTSSLIPMSSKNKQQNERQQWVKLQWPVIYSIIWTKNGSTLIVFPCHLWHLDSWLYKESIWKCDFRLWGIVWAIFIM